MKVVKLGDVCDVIGGGTPSKSDADFWGGDILWASVRDMKRPIIESTEFSITKKGLENSSTNLIPKDNVIIASRVGLGKVCLLRNDTAINQDLRAIIPKDDTALNKMFLFWWLRSVAWQIEKAGVGATVKGVTLPFIKSLELPLLSLEEQRRIVARLDAAFEKISAAEVLTRQNLDSVSALQKSILDKYLSVSDSTRTHRLADLLKICHGKDWKSLASGAIPVYGSGGFMGKYVDTVAYDKPTVLLPRKGTITNIFYLEEPFWNVDTVFYTKIDTDKLIPRYFYYFMQTVDLQALDSGSGRPSLTQTALYEITMSVPSITEQTTTVAKLDDTFNKTRKLESQYKKKLAKLTDLRQSLLAEAFMTTSAV